MGWEPWREDDILYEIRGCRLMHGGAGLLMDLLKNGIGSGVMVLMRAALGGIKARSLGPCP